MSSRQLKWLLVITTVAMVTATVVVKIGTPQTAAQQALFFPDLAETINTIDQLTIKGYAEEINLKVRNNRWGIVEFDDYPALPEKVNSTLLAVAALKINAPKTALPRLYHRLGVEGPNVPDTSSLLLRLAANGNNIIEVIIGNKRRSSTAETKPGLYLRELGQEQSYLVDGAVAITAVKTDWIARNLLDIPADQVKQVHVEHADGDSFTLAKAEKGQDDFKLMALPSGKQQASNLIINRLGSILQDIQINGARSNAVLLPTADVITAEITTFDGMIATMTTFLHDGIAYAGFSFNHHLQQSAAPAKTEQQASMIAELNARTEGWWFEISDFKYTTLNKRSAALMRDG